jgi:hypothetical protein
MPDYGSNRFFVLGFKNKLATYEVYTYILSIGANQPDNVRQWIMEI